MRIFNNILGKKHTSIKNYNNFWKWFNKNEQVFYNAVKSGNNIEEIFFDKLSLKLDEIKEGMYFQTGMFDDSTVELVITPDCDLKNIVFAEEIVNAAPKIKNWKFTALKSGFDIDKVKINTAGYTFDGDKLSFYPLDNEDYPDKIDIAIVHNDYKEDDKSNLLYGVSLFLDNYLGELNFVTSIDNLNLIPKEEAEKELISISELKNFLSQREKQFVENYSDVRYNTENDSYSSFETELQNGKPLVAIMNKTLLDWNCKASHPWILEVEVKYDGNNNNGMPNKKIYSRLDLLEDEMMFNLKDFEGYLNIGRQTADNSRLIYFACKDFRKPSKVMNDINLKYIDELDLSYEIYKDKYWQSFEIK